MQSLQSIYDQFNSSKPLEAIRQKIRGGSDDLGNPNYIKTILDSFDITAMNTQARDAGTDLANYIDTKRIARLQETNDYDAWLNKNTYPNDLTRMAADLVLLVVETAKAASLSEFANELEAKILRPMLSSLSEQLSRAGDFKAKVGNLMWNILDLVEQRLGDEAADRVRILINLTGLMLPQAKDIPIRTEDLPQPKTA